MFNRIFLTLTALLFLIGCTSFPPRDLSQNANSIAECPASPNCVSSQSKSREHLVQPIPFSGNMNEFKDQVLKLSSILPRTQIARVDGPYIHLISTSLIFRFKDDIELYFNETDKIIHIRSASRVGYSDLGINRKRVESIREFF